LSLVPFLVLAIAAAAASLVSRGRARFEVPVGVGGLAVATIAALSIRPDDVLRLGSGEVLVATAFGRLFLVLGAVSGLVLCLIAMSTTWQPNLPAALLVGLAGIGIGLAVTDPLTALLVLFATAVATSLVSLDTRSASGQAPLQVQMISGQLRLIGGASLLAVAAVAWAASASAGIGSEPAAFGLADLAIVMAVALRFGAIPFHRPVARLTDSAPGLALPLLLVWGPAALAVVVLGTSDGSTLTLLVPDEIGRALIVAGATASLLLGAVGAWLQDDLEHVVGYSIIQDAGFVLLGLAIGGSVAHEPARIWLLVLVAAKTAFATWATVLEARFGTARLPDLGGWARRSPLLGAALVGIVVATLGAPGLAAWGARTALIDDATGEPLEAILLVGGIASLVYYGRIAAIGIGRPSVAVRGAPTERPALMPAGSLAATLRMGWQGNRAPIAAGLVLVLVVLSLAVSAGGLGGPEAAGAAAPQPSPAAINP
jgi:NADH:ubiquinone oxidoreductase subunit 2 (subunit N)